MSRLLGAIVYNWPLKLMALALATLLYAGLVVSQNVQARDVSVQIQSLNQPAGTILIGSLGESGLDIRAAIHTGEIVLGERDVGGIGVHIAARLLGEAGERQVVVTRTVRDLATGGDLAFVPLGTVSLRGVPGEWELFEASTTKGD